MALLNIEPSRIAWLGALSIFTSAINPEEKSSF
jgi:hypothetical protein